MERFEKKKNRKTIGGAVADAAHKFTLATTVAGGLGIAAHLQDPHRDEASRFPTEQSDTDQTQENPDIHIEAEAFPHIGFTAEELHCAIDNTYYEARGENQQGRYAAIFVPLERALSKGHPQDICGVVWEPLQFSWTADTELQLRPIDQKEYQRVAIDVYKIMHGKTLQEAAREAQFLSGLPRGAIYYKMVNFEGSPKVKAYFATLQHVSRINHHDFYIDPKEIPLPRPRPVEQPPHKTHSLAPKIASKTLKANKG